MKHFFFLILLQNVIIFGTQSDQCISSFFETFYVAREQNNIEYCESANQQLFY